PHHRRLPGTCVQVKSSEENSFICFLQAWIRSLNFSIVDEWRAWHVDGQAAGFTILYANNLTFATVKGGGHTSIETNPKQGFAMGKRWLDNKPL
ncbi:Os03g0730400, partial [Oryza sativa Japonica Group]